MRTVALSRYLTCDRGKRWLVAGTNPESAGMKFDPLTAFGLFAVTAMLPGSALDRKGRR
jgi:hypothetical protein